MKIWCCSFWQMGIKPAERMRYVICATLETARLNSREVRSSLYENLAPMMRYRDNHVYPSLGSPGVLVAGTICCGSPEVWCPLDSRRVRCATWKREGRPDSRENRRNNLPVTPWAVAACPHRQVIDLVTSAVAFEPRAEDPDSDRSLGESPSHFSASEDAVPRPCHDERPTADGDSRPGAAGILELAAKAREGSGPVGATIGDTGDGDESDEGLGSSWGSVSSVQDEAPAEGFEGFSRRGGGTSAGRRGGGACGRIGVVDFEDDEEDDETVLRGVWFPRPDVTAPSFEANAASRTGGADLKGARETSSVPWEVGRAKGAAGHETPAVDVTPRVSPPPRPPPLQAAPRRERHEAAATVATSSAHPGGRARGWWDSGNGYHATASPSNGRGCRNVRGDQPGLGSEGGENGDARHGGLRATASTVYHGEVGVSRSSSLGAPHVARGGEGNGRRSTPPPALNRSRSENRRPRVEVRDDAGNVREVVESGLASRSTRNAVDFSGDARESQSGNEPDRLRFGGGRNLEDVSFPHERDLLIAQDSFSGEDDEGSESGYEEFVVLVSREATVKELAAKVADFPAEWLGEAFGTVIRRQVEGGTYDARARAAMKRAVRLLGGRVSWRQVWAFAFRPLVGVRSPDEEMAYFHLSILETKHILVG